MRKILVILLSILLLAGCSSKTSVNDNYGYTEEAVISPEGFGLNKAFDYSEGEAKMASTPEIERKLIVSSNISFETENLENTIEKISSAVAKTNSYIQSSYLDKNYLGGRYLTEVIRVPANNFDLFLNEIKNNENMISFSINREDITENYYDVDARIKSLKAQINTVEEFYKKAENLEEIMQVQQELSNLQFELDEYERKMKNYELLTTYNTVTITITETKIFSATEQDSFGERLIKGIKKSWEKFKIDSENFVVCLAENLIEIIVGAIVLCIAIFIVKKCIKTSKNKKALKEQNAQKTVASHDSATKKRK